MRAAGTCDAPGLSKRASAWHLHPLSIVHTGTKVSISSQLAANTERSAVLNLASGRISTASVLRARALGAQRYVHVVGLRTLTPDHK